MLGRGSGLPVDACIDVLAISPKDSSSGEGRGRPDSIRSGGVAIVQGSLHESLSLVNTELSMRKIGGREAETALLK